MGTGDQPDGIRLHRLGFVRLCFVCWRQHRLARATSVTLGDLADETFIDFPRGWGNRTLADRAFARVGIVRRIPFEAADQETALGLVRHRLGVTLLPRIGSEDDDVAVIDVSDTDLDLTICLATPSDRPSSAATLALRDSILRSAGRKASSV